MRRRRVLRPQGAPPPISPGVLILAVIAGLIGYSAWKNGTLTENRLLFYAVLIPSVILHEVSHGWLANIYGDPTAKNAGRLTLNPLRHVDAFGTFIIPAVMLLSFGVAFGYAKPVPVNTSRMTRNQAMFTGLIGPATNIVIALIAAFLINVAFPNLMPVTFEKRLLFVIGMANVVLAVFNLIPIPPLDGSSVIERFLPQRYWSTYLQFRRYSMFLLLLILLLGQNVLASLFDPALELWLRLLPWDLVI